MSPLRFTLGQDSLQSDPQFLLATRSRAGPALLSAGFGVFAVFILPKLKMDPEEEPKEGEGSEQVAGGPAQERLTSQQQSAGRRSGSSRRRD